MHAIMSGIVFVISVIFITVHHLLCFWQESTSDNVLLLLDSLPEYHNLCMIFRAHHFILISAVY